MSSYNDCPICHSGLIKSNANGGIYFSCDSCKQYYCYCDNNCIIQDVFHSNELTTELESMKLKFIVVRTMGQTYLSFAIKDNWNNGIHIDRVFGIDEIYPIDRFKKLMLYK